MLQFKQTSRTATPIFPTLYPTTQGITHNTSVILEVEVDTVWPSPGLALTDDNSGHDLLTELRLSLLDGGHDHVTDTRGGETVEARTNALNRDDVEVASTRVVAAVEDGSTIRRMSLASLFPPVFPFRELRFVCL